MTITPAVRSNSNFASGSSTTSITTTLAANTAGSFVVVCVGWFDPAGTVTCTVADNNGGGTNAFTAIGSKVRNTTQQYSIQMFRRWNIAAQGSTVTYTATFSGAVDFRDIKAHESTSSNGSFTSDPYDSGGYAQKTGTGNSTALATSSGTPSENNCMIVTYGAANSGTISAGSGFTLRQTGANGLGVADLVQTTAAAKQGLLTTSVSSQWGITAAAFKDVPAAVSDAGGALAFFL